MSSGRVRFRRIVVSVAAGAILAGCELFDSPTTATQVSPIRIASDGVRAIFASPGESNTCPFLGGPVRLAEKAGPGSGGAAANRFAYVRASADADADVVTIGTAAATIDVAGDGRYRITSDARPGRWLALRTLRLPGRTGVRDARVTVVPVAGHAVKIRALDDAGRPEFVGVFIAAHKRVLVRDASFPARAVDYALSSVHDCGNWDTAATATAALRRTLARVSAIEARV